MANGLKQVVLMKELSIIIPYCNEYPQIIFTVQNVINEIEGIDAEVIAVANCCNPEDKSYEKLCASPFARRQHVLKSIKFDEKQGHWNAKNAGIEVAEGKRILFLDSHCILKKDSILEMMKTPCPGTLHMQISYMLDSKRLIYSARPEQMHYTFAGAPQDKIEPYNVPVMSTCGMMIERTTLDHIGKWNPELGIYGGGENYMMYKIATCGFPIQIHPKAVVYHYAEKRGYSWNYDDHMRNQFIAAYCVGGEEWLKKLVDMRKDRKNSNKEIIDRIANDVVEKCKKDREYIKSIQKVSLEEHFHNYI